MNHPDEYETVKKEIRSLLITFKNGCSLFEFKKQYQMMIGQELPFMQFGFRNEIEFLYSMPDVIQISPKGKDYHLMVIADISTKHLQKLVSKQKSFKHNPVSRPKPFQLVETPPRFRKLHSAQWGAKDKSRLKQLPPKGNYGCFKQKMDCLDDFDLSRSKNPEARRSSEKMKNYPIEFFPPKAVSPLSQYNQQRLPAQLVLGSFFPAYVATILNPSHMYIQLGDVEQALSDMNHSLEKFYSDPESRVFMMKNVHILPGSIGVAQWPLDMHWYRIKVMSLETNESVKVFFVDYGTVDIISKTLLRYIREDFFNFPAQAMKASLAYVKSPRGFNIWSQKATERILELSLDESVRAKVEDIEDDVLSVILYSKHNIYINGALLDENLAQSTSVDSNYPELEDVSRAVSFDCNKSLCELPAATSSPSAKAKQSVISTSQASQSFYENPSIDESLQPVNFSKSFEVDSTSTTAPITYPKPQIAETELFLNKTSNLPIYDDTNSNNSSPSNSSNEIFDDDDDAFFEEFCQKVSLVTKRYAKRIKTCDGYVFHILIYKSKPFVSCGDISHLIWSNKDSDFLQQRLENSGSFQSNVLLWKDENVDMFNQLKRFHVKGFKVVNDRTCLLIFYLNDLIKILNTFGHPSIELRKKIIHEYSAFNPDHPMWQELSGFEFSDSEEEFFHETEEDKLNRLCLNDLQVMKQNIRIRLQLQQTGSPENVLYEKQKLHLLHEKIVMRMKEIQLICSNFSDA
ncbi:tudor domain-containing protein 5-like isoform X1 [Argiope bruennichi]|uniref:tudor domain-containing protein 5-like isoform X1 n=2 Tax=Argiope bruennichi TaxID=94029 RepID=UPI0024950483|nr:tudor domain-containing protein 5-like isoform X1 [Argiope bruennichi]